MEDERMSSVRFSLTNCTFIFISGFLFLVFFFEGRENQSTENFLASSTSSMIAKKGYQRPMSILGTELVTRDTLSKCECLNVNVLD